MLIDTDLGNLLNGFRHVDLSPRLQRLIAARAGFYACHDASAADLAEISAAVRASVPGLADDTTLETLRAHNPQVFQIVIEAASHRVAGFSAQLPLTDAGLTALCAGDFNPRCPNLNHVAQIGETASAIYVWLTYSPRSLVVTMAGLAHYLQRHCPNGGSLFCTPLDSATETFLRKIGFRSAATIYPSAAAALLCAPRKSQRGTETPQRVFEVKVARDLHDIAKVMAVRAATYMFEQECPFDEEFDGNDFSATHLLGIIDGEPAGCLRIRYFGDFVKFERLAVRHEFRASKLAFRLVREALKFAARKGFRKVYGHARRDIVKFWETFGFRPIPGRPIFAFSDVEYVEMEGPIMAPVEAVTAEIDPLRIIRPEGQWDTPGVLERGFNPKRRTRISSNLRR